jgi:DNA replication protein DnaC
VSRDWQLQNAWEFEDYSDLGLIKILRGAAKRRGLVISMETSVAAVGLLAKERMRPNFGNAGAVNNLLSQAVIGMERRLRSMPAAQRALVKTLEPADFGIEEEGRNADGIFADLVGCEDVKKKLKEYQATLAMCQERGLDPLAEMQLNFLFVGPPGTGKTSVARRVGQMFEALGLLASAEVMG